MAKEPCIVLVHQGDLYPDYLQLCFKQIRKWFDGKVYLVTDIEDSRGILSRSRWQENKYRKYSVNIVRTSTYNNTSETEFSKVSFLEDYGRFWNVTMKRLFILEDFMRECKISNVIHLESDVLLYHNPTEQTFRTNGVSINKISSSFSTWAYVMIDEARSLSEVNQIQLEILKKGKVVLEKKYGFAQVNEMLIAADLLSRGAVKALPSLPNSDSSFIYDGASYGQFIGGTADGVPGWFDKSTDVGGAIGSGKIIISWMNDHLGRKHPICVDKTNGFTAKIANLHIHSKKLGLYM